MKVLRESYADAVQSGVTAIAYCLRIERRDGKVFRFTSYDGDLEMLDTGEVYHPDQSSPDETALRVSSDGQSATFDIDGALTANGVSRDEVAAGLFDFATLYCFRTLWDDPHEDDEPLVKGYFGRTEIEDNRYVTEFQSLASALDQSVGRVHSPICDADLGDSLCKVRLTPPSWEANTAYSVRNDGEAETGAVVKPTTENGTHQKCIGGGTSGSSEPTWNTAVGGTTTDGGVTWEAITALTQTDTIAAVTNSGVFTGQLGFPTDWWGGGTVEFISGENAGIRREVKAYDADQYTLWKSMPYPIAVGDQVIATAGCRKRFNEDCQSKFGNHLNFQGYPHLPGEHAVNKFGGQ